MPKITPKNRTYHVSAKLTLDVGMEIAADSLQDAAAKASALKITDFIDFKALDLDHNDSENPDVYSIWRD